MTDSFSLALLIRKGVGKRVQLKSPFSDSAEPEDGGASGDSEAAQAASVEDEVEGVVESHDGSDVGDTAAGASEDEVEPKASEPMYA